MRVKSRAAVLLHPVATRHRSLLFCQNIRPAADIVVLIEGFQEAPLFVLRPLSYANLGKTFKAHVCMELLSIFSLSNTENSVLRQTDTADFTDAGTTPLRGPLLRMQKVRNIVTVHHARRGF